MREEREHAAVRDVRYENRRGEEEVIRVRIPRRDRGEVLGVVEKMLGGRRALVQCEDGVSRMARIPGKLKRQEWINVGDLVILVPWEFQPEKADIIHKYTRPQEEWLRRKGFLK
ncbi:MAG: translation initiation factor eIF-1A [Canidatus Methanoxibalbensis ujae]|nr:translation initiation factor eIF-1A [Candidatus Methanoxibalbensis ujae]